MRSLNTSKFLQTDLNGYLKQGEHVKCISCHNCVKVKDKILQYKYNPRIQTNYGAMFDNKSPGKKGTIFNIDDERRQIKVPFKPPRTFTTTNKLALTNSQGTGLIGALTADGKGYFRRPAPRGETEAIIRRRFNNNSSYAMTFA